MNNETLGGRPPERQGQLPINVPKEARELSEQEFATVAERVMRDFGTNAISTFYQTIRDGGGKEILGTVSQRGTEEEIALESSLEHMFVNTCDVNKLPVVIIGEHHEYRSPKANGEANHIEPTHIGYFDAADNTRQYLQGGQGQQGLPVSLWSVGFIYTLDGRPIAGVIANLKENSMYLSAGGKNYHIDLETQKEREIKPSERTSIKDKGFCLATYLGDPKYALSFFQSFQGVLEALIQANNDAVMLLDAGSFLHGPMAEGTVDAYLMRKEPVSERLPGWGFAQVAGFKAWEINPEDGSYKEVKHDFSHFKDNPDAYREARMSYYLVTRYDQIRDEMIPIIMADYRRNQELEAFLASRQPQNPSAN